MGGKFWSQEELDYFKYVVMRASQYNGPNGSYTPTSGESWEALARMMQRDMGSRALRSYTKSGMYEHFYQVIRGTWPEERRKIIASGRWDAPNHRSSRDRRAKKAQHRARETSTGSMATGQSSYGSNGSAGPRNGFAVDSFHTNIPPIAQEDLGIQAPIRYIGFQGPRVAPERYTSPSMTGESHDRRASASDTPYLTHAQGAALYHQSTLPRSGRGRGHSHREHHAQRHRAAPAAFNQGMTQPRRQTILVREPTRDHLDQSSLFIEDSRQESNLNTVQEPRPRVELDAAHTMTTFWEQERHTLHGGHVPRHQDLTEVRRDMMHGGAYEHQPRAVSGPRLAPMAVRRYSPYRCKTRTRFEEDDEIDEIDEDGEDDEDD